MKPMVLISQKTFDEAVAIVKKDFEVEENQSENPPPPQILIQKLQDKMGAIILPR
jgi:hypothetical protein